MKEENQREVKEKRLDTMEEVSRGNFGALGWVATTSAWETAYFLIWCHLKLIQSDSSSPSA